MAQKSLYYLWLAIFVAMSTLTAPAFAEPNDKPNVWQRLGNSRIGRAAKVLFSKDSQSPSGAQQGTTDVLPQPGPEDVMERENLSGRRSADGRPLTTGQPSDNGKGHQGNYRNDKNSQEDRRSNMNANGDGHNEKYSPGEALEKFTVNVTKAAKAGKFSRYIGRSSLLQRGRDILNKGGNKAFWLLGEAGSGKTAYVESIAGQIPEGVEVRRLDLRILEAGTAYKGVLESRLKAISEDFVNSNGKYILFIDEVHVVMRSKEFVEYVKPSMARGEISFIGATTLDEFREIEKDSAFKERAVTLTLPNPTFDEVLAGLRLRRDKYEKQHGIMVDDMAMRKATEYAFRYFPFSSPHRIADSILDETMSRAKSEAVNGAYELLDLYDRREMIEIEKASLEKDAVNIYNGPEHEGEKQELRRKIAELEHEERTIEGRIEDIKKSESFEDLQKRITEMESDFEKLKNGNDMIRRANLQNSIKDLKSKLAGKNPKNITAITERQIARTVAQMRDMPLDFILQGSSERLERMEEYMNSRVLNSKRQIEILKKHLSIRMANVVPVEGAAIVMMLAGPTGAGKSEFVKALAMGLFGSADAVIRMDGNEYKNAEMGITKMVGSGPGYKDSDNGGAITEQIRRKPFSIVAIEEFDKMNTDVIRYWMEAWDNGFMRDGYGRKIDCRNVMFMITTNLGAEFALLKPKLEKDYGKNWVNEGLARQRIEMTFGLEPGSLNGLSEFEMDAKLLEKALLGKVPPEIINRLTVQILAKAITFDDAKSIARKLVDYLKEHNMKEHGIKVEVTDKAIEALTKMTFEEAYGARPLKRGRDATLGYIMSQMVMKHHVRKGETVKIDFTENSSKNGGQLIGETGAQIKLIAAEDIMFKSTFRPETFAAAKADGEVGREAPKNATEAVKRGVGKLRERGK